MVKNYDKVQSNSHFLQVYEIDMVLLQSGLGIGF